MNNNIEKINIKLLTQNAISFKIATKGSAGYDIYCDCIEDIILLPDETKMIKTGVAIEIPIGYCGLIYPRSSNAKNYGLILKNCVGVIDSDYRGEIMIPIINISDETFVIKNHFKIAQLVLTPIITPQLNVVEDLSTTQRGVNGFGSTGEY